MIAGAVFLTWLSPAVFALLVFAIATLMTWEWSRMVRGKDFDRFALLQTAVVAAVIAITLFGGANAALWGAMLIAAAALLAVAMGLGPLTALGVVYVAVPAAALVWLRASPDLGFEVILFLFAVVWATDSFAMVFGQNVGGPRLWPAVSPNKTWAGALGGLAAAAIVGAMFATFFLPGQSVAYGLTVAMYLSIMAQIGDLGESAVKRQTRVKDTSGIIPGHGGVLDRMDGIVGASVAAAALALAIGWQAPARVVLIGG